MERITWNKELIKKEALKYNTRSQFARNASGAYAAAKRLGCFDEVCAHMTILWQKKWNDESCKKEAGKYKTRTAFQNNCPGAYSYAEKHNILDIICAHMTILWQPKWSFEKCKRAALECNSRTEFQDKYPGAWDYANRNGFLDQICKHMKVFGNHYKRCIYAVEFPDHSVYIGLTCNLHRRIGQHETCKRSAVFVYIKSHGLKPRFKQISNYVDKDLASILEGETLERYKKERWMILNRTKTGALGGGTRFWTKENCIKAAGLCKTRGEFETRFNGAYYSCKNNGWLPYIYKILPLKYKVWSYEELKSEAQKYKRVKDFREYSKEAYYAAMNRHILKGLCASMEPDRRGKHWDEDSVRKEAAKYKLRNHFYNGCRGAYNAAKRLNLLDELYPIKKKVIVKKIKHRRQLKWTLETCRVRASLYKTKSEFKRNDGSAYSTSVRHGWLKEICKHMITPEPYNKKWTKDACHKVALRYSIYKDFRTKEASAYVTARRNGWLNEICSHLKKKRKNNSNNKQK